MDCIGFYAVLATSPPYIAGGPKSPKIFSKLPNYRSLTNPIVDNISIRWKKRRLQLSIIMTHTYYNNSKHCETPDIILNYHECPGWQGICLSSPSSNNCITTKRLLLLCIISYCTSCIFLISMFYLIRRWSIGSTAWHE